MAARLLELIDGVITVSQAGLELTVEPKLTSNSQRPNLFSLLSAVLIGVSYRVWSVKLK